MGMVMRNHELVESGAYPYGFAPEVDAWREVAEDRDSEASASMEALELSGDLDPSVDLSGEQVMEELVSSLLGLSLGSGTNPPASVVGTGSNGRSADRWSKGVISALRSLLGEGEEYASNSVLVVASTLAVQQQFRSEDLYQSNWYRESASENI
ncbi:hypothetical protein AYI68_g3279 [Smittium mucronatum]|uniref:Uncharacterized protein n=1 Tax=Smittium mucronatum TaxID=133383 RepID=A0A1R0H0D2_9FUNG|nr:hypothetical protein AYI68_g3279 [Smittium mucronatum]